MVLEQSQHKATQGFPGEIAKSDEWYNFQRFNPRVQVLLKLDEESYQGGTMGEEHPIAWHHDYDGGRSFYTGFGHTTAAYSDDLVLDHIAGGIAYAMGEGGELDYSRAQPESWRLNRVILDSGMDEAVALAFRPDGALYYIERKGALMRFDFDAGQSVQVDGFNVYHEGENGLIGITFDPDYAQNHWLYLFHTMDSVDGPAHILSRYRMQDDVLDRASEQRLLEIPIDAGQLSHTGGTLQFDGEGSLWISTGDNTNPHESNGYSPSDDRPGRLVFDAARSSGNTMDLRGKILRIIPQADGGYAIPGGNLFVDAEQGRQEIYAMGLRNPYRMYFDDHRKALYWGEVGPDARAHSGDRGPWGFDEFIRTEVPGNFGWPFVIANSQPYAYFDFDSGATHGRYA